MKGRKWIVAFLWIAVIAFITQFAFIAAEPHIIFKIAQKRSASPRNVWIAAPKTDAKLRRVVLPNPDFIYSACFYDLSRGDLFISGEFPDSSVYCSLAFYGNDVQPYYVVNNVDGSSGKYEFKLSTTQERENIIKAKTSEGVVLMRVLIKDSADLNFAKQVQARLTAEIIPDR